MPAERLTNHLKDNSELWAIGALVLSVTAYDLLSSENHTISSGVDRLRDNDNPAIRAATWAGLGISALHLTRAWDRLGIPQMDPIHAGGKWIRGGFGTHPS